jgi:hypothetical protein
VGSDDTAIVWGDDEWRLAEDAVERWVKEALSRWGVTTFWRDRAHGHISEPSAELAFGDENPMGTFDEAIVEESPDGKLVTRIRGYREVMFQVKFRTRNHNTFRMGRRYAGILLQTLAHPYYEGILRAGGLGLIEPEPVRAFPMKSEDGTRWESMALLEVKFSITQELVDEQADAELGWVDTISVAVGMDGQTPGPVRSIDVRPSVINPPED